jgi:hypothetical protein
MNVGELRTLLTGLDDELLVVLQADAEGNGYSPLDGGEVAIYVPLSTWSGEVYNDDEKPDDGKRVLVLWPVN